MVTRDAGVARTRDAAAPEVPHFLTARNAAVMSIRVDVVTGMSPFFNATVVSRMYR
jgi:hypothetical protein